METLRLLAIEFSERVQQSEDAYSHEHFAGPMLAGRLDDAKVEHEIRVQQVNAVYEKAVSDLTGHAK